MTVSRFSHLKQFTFLALWASFVLGGPSDVSAGELDGMLWGWEPTVSSEEMVVMDDGPNGESNGPENYEARDRYAQRMRELCKKRGDCEIRKVTDKWGEVAYKVTYSDGWYFYITVDPGVVEILPKPNTLKGYRKLRERMQRDFFELASELGLEPRIDAGGGQIHGDGKVFFDDPVLFRNFLVDFANHPELATGVFEFDRINAPALASDERMRKAFSKVIEEFDEGKIKGTEELAREVTRQVYDRFANFRLKRERVRLHALNLLRMFSPKIKESERTIEIRSVRAQKSVDEFLLQIDLFQARLEYLKGLKERVVYESPSDHRSVSDRISAFKRYVTESGKDWKRYKVFIPEKWSAKSCEKLLR